MFVLILLQINRQTLNVINLGISTVLEMWNSTQYSMFINLYAVENVTGSDFLEHSGVAGRITLRWILRKWGEGGHDSCGSG
jgi:hypothetical protein